MIQIKSKVLKTFFWILASVLFIIGLKMFFEMWQEGKFITTITQYPRKTLGFVIDIDKRELLFEQLEKFADAHNFGIHIKNTTPAGETFSITLSRKDVSISIDNVFHPTAYDIYFYDGKHSKPVSEENLNYLFNEIKIFISEVPNIRIFNDSYIINP